MSRLRITFLAATLLNAALLWYFHDRFWYPTDDGLYAHVAERVLDGEVLNRDIQDIHPGYIHFLHAAAFRLFGIDLVSLRYPLIAAALLQACVVFLLLQRRGTMLAMAGSVGVTALGVIQWVSPTANWYCGSLTIVLAWWMLSLPRGHRARLSGAGLLLGTIVLFRHLSGVWVAMGLLSLALLDSPQNGRGRKVLVARSLLGLMLAALIAYLGFSPETEPGGVLLMALWPAATLGWMLANVRVTNRDTAAILGQLAAGAAVPFAPLLLYHILHGSVARAVADIVGAAAGETLMGFFGHGWYGVLPVAGLYQAIDSFTAVKVSNGLYWAILPALSAVNGVYLLAHLRRGTPASDLTLPVLAAFYALVAIYLEGPLYLYYTAGISLAAVLWFAGTASRPMRLAWISAAWGMSAIAIVFHAGQSARRTPLEILAGTRVTPTAHLQVADLDRCRLRLEPTERDTYAGLVAFIHQQTTANESIVALPNDSELFFLARRRNAFWFYNSALGMRTASDVTRALFVLKEDQPRLVLFRPGDKYNTDASKQIMAVVIQTYRRLGTISGLDVYRR